MALGQARTHIHTHTDILAGRVVGGGPCRPSSECTQILDECITLSEVISNFLAQTHLERQDT